LEYESSAAVFPALLLCWITTHRALLLLRTHTVVCDAMPFVTPSIFFVLWQSPGRTAASSLLLSVEVAIMHDVRASTVLLLLCCCE
jgi:hypothetical protein